ncbi:NUDIX hydrolase domain-like protein [Aspergillus aurantiobrunneus]
MSVQFNYTVAPHLKEFTVPFPTFRAARPEYAHYVGGGLIFSRTATGSEAQNDKDGIDGQAQQPLRLLLLQRSFEDSYGGHWEGPGGSCDPEDVTVLDGVAREVLEESGLHVSRFIELAGADEWVKLRSDRVDVVVKYTFIVEVHEAKAVVSGAERDDSGIPAAKREDGTVVSGLQKRWEDKVKLDPAEHRAFDWVTEEEVRISGEDTSGRFKSFANQEKTMLDAFRMLRERPLLFEGGGDI